MIEDAGWRLARTRGPIASTITLTGPAPNRARQAQRRRASQNAGQHQEAGRAMSQQRYVVVVEGVPGTNYSA